MIQHFLKRLLSRKYRLENKKKEVEARQQAEKQEDLENDPFLTLISDPEFMKKMEELYWEIRAEEEETDQQFEDIKRRRLREMGFESKTPEWKAAEEGIAEAASDVAIGRAEASGFPDEEEWVQEWEQRKIDEGYVRLFCREIEKRYAGKANSR